MCGIAGFTPPPYAGDSARILKRMLIRIRHRGPDQSGIYLKTGAVGLGSVRLSILDLATGRMPMSNADESLWIVFNGEVFNYLELRKELETRNHRFKTSGDTEVVLHMYEEYGPAFLNKLNGQFAIAIWDARKNQLFLARDRVGIRPIFYSQVGEHFVFASEIKALTEFPGIKCRISPRVLSQVFTLWTPISPETIFENIYEVPPGHYFIIGASGMIKRRYWELPVYSPDAPRAMNFREAVEQFDTLFTDAVRIRMRADVPIGAYLSGGLDSSITTSYIKKLSPGNLRTFSIGFRDQEFDETSYQSLAVKHLQTDHTYFSCRAEEIASSFPKVVWHAETPLLRTAPGPMQLLSGVVHDADFKVVFTGEGADELLGGYDIFKEAIIREWWAKDPASRLRPKLLARLYPFLPQSNQSPLAALRFFYGYRLEETGSPVYSHLLRWNNTSRIKAYFSKELKESISGYDPIRQVEESVTEKFRGLDLLSRAQWLEVTQFMSGYLLSSQGDRMAMSNSVEGRYPFLDYRIIEFCMKLPPDFKMKGLNEKVLLKELAKGKLPLEILRRPKQSYRAPITESFFSATAPDYISEHLSYTGIVSSGLFDADLVEKLVCRMRTGRPVSEIDNMAITGILSAQLLNDLFVRRATPEIPADDLSACTITVHQTS